MKIIYSLILILISSSFLFADKKISEDKYFPNYPADQDMIFTKKNDNMLNKGLQYGAWITPVMLFQEDTLQSLATSQNTALIWFKTYLWDNSFFYLRGKYTFMANYYKKNYPVDTFYHLPTLDMAFIKMGFLQRTIELSIGRKYFTIGSGLVLNGKGDGLEFNLNTKYINLQIMGAYTGLLFNEANPYNLSTQDNQNGNRRIFTGGTISTTFFNQSLYFLALAQFDLGADLAQRYHSQYYGAGIKGTILDFWVYHGEYVYETGQSSYATSISAMAVSIKMDFYIPLFLKPVVHLHYHFGSGDSDRNENMSPSGNTTGTVDNGFIGFGTFVAGYALRPLPGNLHALRLGFTISPFSWIDLVYVKRMSLTIKYSVYFKDKADSVISVSDALLNDVFVGQGLDFTYKWRIFSDLSFYSTYAFFIPGAAYPSIYELEHFFTAGLNLSF
jgi:hypothetical protein